MIDPTVLSLIESVIQSPVKLQLLVMFHENQRLEATASALADRVCRDIWSISEALAELAVDGVMLQAATAHGEPVYRYAPTPELRTPIERLMCSYDDPLERDLIQRAIREQADLALFRRARAFDSAQVA
jgi:hypothetical protein